MMTRLLMQLLPYSKKIGYNLTYNRCLYWVKNGICRHSNFAVLVKCKNNLPLLPNQFHWSGINHIHISLKCSTCEQDEDIAETEEVGFPLTKSFYLEDYSEQFRNTLYPNLDDPILTQLKSCESVKQLLKVMNDNLSSLTGEHYCQLILVLWDLVKLNHGGTDPVYKLLSFNRRENVNDLIPVVLKSLSSIGLSNNLEELSSEALVCSILYSNRLGVSLKHPFIQTLLLRISNLLEDEDIKTFSLSAVSRLTIALSEDRPSELWSKLFLIKTLPLIRIYFDNCSSAEDFRALTISMLSTVPYLREDLLVQYEALTEGFLRNGTLMKDQSSTIVKAALLLSNIYYKPTARYMVYELLRMLSGHLNRLFLPHLITIQKIVWTNAEPHYTIMELAKLKNSCSKKVITINPMIFFAKCNFAFNIFNNQEAVVMLKDFINGVNDLQLLVNVQFDITDLDVSHMFWNKVAQLVISSDQPVDTTILQQICFRYMDFTSRMSSYRNKQFEMHLISLITTELVEGISRHKPKVFAVFAAFVFAFKHHYHVASNLCSDILPHLLSMIEQFDVETCLILSKGLKHSLHHLRNRELQLYLQLDSALNERTHQILRTTDNMSIQAYNMILRSCINRKGYLESDFMQDVLKRSEHLDYSQLNSRCLKNLTYNFNIINTLVPTAVDNMVEHCLENRQYVTGDTVGKLAFLCYILGYTPRHAHSFCDITGDLVIRDCDSMNGLTVLQVALALSFFNQLPSSLNSLIFTVKFLERLDEEIKNCYAKDKYPLRVKQTLMQLNRSVCLDQPEADVPWFHSKFCEEQQSIGISEVKHKSLIFTDVLSTLTTLMGNSSYISTRVFTPYGYTLDIQINLDGALNPVPFKDSKNAVHKLAILLYYKDSYTNFERRLNGYHQMKQRHLEILGYKVISLSDSLWNAMFMAEPKAKVDYLRKLIWPSKQLGEETAENVTNNTDIIP